MNALASVLSAAASTPSAPQSAAARAEGDEAETHARGFAQCMAQARQAQAEPAQDDEPAADGAAGDAPPDVAASASEPAAAPPDLAALLPGWSAVAPITAGEPAATPKATAEHDALLALDPKVAKPTATATDESNMPSPATAARAAAESPATPEHPNDFALPAREAAPHGRAVPRAAIPDNAAAPLPAAATPIAAPTAPARAPDGPAPMAHLPAPIDTPAFAPALATQVRWWAHEGVQQAQLTLSPPEMGPVTVKIVLHEQREARIDFVADLAATRTALEAALPVLAAALDESGLKLAGGGVHDGAAQRQALWQQAQQPHAARGPAATTGAAAQSVTLGHADNGLRTHGARGLVDLVA
jgi:flagellar hook-length control protein FliK